ncbi:Similar to gi/3844599 F31D5.2 gene product from Caenorhabditis elegans cosmid gb/U28941 and contains PF/00097 Zinc (Ring) finger C3HC4 domain. ESTs gb/F19963 and gb/T42582 come from this gene [Arabidopsis thaliana]|uniref:E3 ubiquitin-protein ligase RGLG4 n=3 Tax=Arabidopsis TaxID=3701 RepID=RGLG4_ARATH|nr:Ca(2)-dependent phospholipid-binding protein (Copine) family [Arabidopsis thaliana]Q9SAL0.1 RecName: Full=E3 ubiquitin-protein ligase RGLG4; AltName: Full=RING domain ligase 4 [Arabidopsis thaliana]KAG7660124.1 von Willebrand factor type A [Arabidopsis suecica]AAD30238.1 Similar to gi/3844599 F31D5.2 gene product from Caenorhabditis elegans cosmid gb/U28941 and contains PF/00097 Zinc (Ring) finger C3HC4 domain. ESTs gb/F19963 and gb/T42582 come from this gene [Arabidopsis thaliana]AAK50068.1|eukprot:NP_565206.1 Ca(2)-dependent phospholipid-binding protein (Copine) family [Arabidopsis thaliana]
MTMGNFLKRFGSGKSRSSRNMTLGTTSSQSHEPSPSDPSLSLADNTNATKKKYALIPDRFSSLDQVSKALREAGLESSNLILGVDFTKSNEWTGKTSFDGKCLHALGETSNPYEKAIFVIGQTLAPFDEDNLIPCFGFGDSTTHDEEVFGFHSDNSPCHGFEEVLACYKRIAPNLRLSGPTSYGPLIDAAVDIVEKNNGQFHVLVIVADGQVTRGTDMAEGELSQQEKTTIDAIVNASSYALSIVLVGVGDGPWEDMRKFDDKIPKREFDNFQFVNFTEIMTRNSPESAKETAFALAALMEIPFQYQAAIELRLLGKQTGLAKTIVPRPPPIPYTPPTNAELPSTASPASPEQTQSCPICLTNRKDVAFSCGHMTCGDCGSKISNCPICRVRITNRLKLYT